MEYIILLNPGTRAAELVTDMRGFVESFYLYDEALELAEKYKESGDCRDYEIYQRTTN